MIDSKAGKKNELIHATQIAVTYMNHVLEG